jgi:AcrR family transcriptional regulator
MSTTPAASASRRRVSEAADPQQAPDAQLGATARLMLDVAEKLLAERGFEHVSLRDIVNESGQRNLSAARYHFGSREQLIGALIARRMWHINEDRHARFDALEASGRQGDVRALVHESLDALAHTVRTESWGADYVRVAAQATFSPLLRINDLIDPRCRSGHLRFVQLARAALPDLPDRVVSDRVRLINNEIVYAIARWIHDHGPVTPSNRRRYDALVRHTIEFLAAGMAAPHGDSE